VSILSVSIIGTIKYNIRTSCASFSFEADIPLEVFEMRAIEGVHAVSSLNRVCFRSGDCIFWPWRCLGLSLRVAVDRSSRHWGCLVGQLVDVGALGDDLQSQWRIVIQIKDNR
jgi:hypothetical protein